MTFIEQYLKKKDVVSNIYVYEDGVVKGFLQMAEGKFTNCTWMFVFRTKESAIS